MAGFFFLESIVKANGKHKGHAVRVCLVQALSLTARTNETQA